MTELSRKFTVLLPVIYGCELVRQHASITSGQLFVDEEKIAAPGTAAEWVAKERSG